MATTYEEQINLITDAYAKPEAPAAQLWQWARCAEERNQESVELITVHDSCDNFPILDFLSAKHILTDEIGHKHAVLGSSFTGDVEAPWMVPLNSRPGATRGEYASLTADDIKEKLQNGVAKFNYKDVPIRLYAFSYVLQFSQPRLYVFASNDGHAAKSLIADVYAWASQAHEETWVYHGLKGGWRKDKAFFKSINATSEDDLVLPGNILAQLYCDSSNFFRSQAVFRDLGLVWERGILLVGPPGNGKTGAVRLIAKRCAQEGVPALYVQSAKTRFGPEQGISTIFDKARRQAPCLLILEDIDTLVLGDTRSMMLNELDGLESNNGILVIGTANDESKLDAAITKRPSRFDAKYKFDLPDSELRRRFLRIWVKSKVGEARWEYENKAQEDESAAADQLIEELAKVTEGWSFAFLKELFVSFVLSQSQATSGISDDMKAGWHQGARLRAADLLAQRQILRVRVDKLVTVR